VKNGVKVALIIVWQADDGSTHVGPIRELSTEHRTGRGKRSGEPKFTRLPGTSHYSDDRGVGIGKRRRRLGR